MNARPKLVLHLGANKTGSSAIQTSLALNVIALRDRGFIVPNANFEVADKIDGHHVWVMGRLLQNPVEGRETLRNALAKLAGRSSETTVILSAENLAAHPEAPAMFRGIEDICDTRVILYVRRQDDYLLSSWQQWNSKVNNDFWAWLITNVGTVGDWRSYLQNWERVFPQAAITVRVFERPRLARNDVVADFYSWLGLSEASEAFEQPPKDVNPSFNDAIVDLVSGSKVVFENVHDNGFYNFVRELTGDAYLKQSRDSMISDAQRRAILSRYEEGNKWVAARYLPDEAGPLFMPVGRSNFVHKNAETIQKEQMRFLATVVYQLYQQQKKPGHG